MPANKCPKVNPPRVAAVVSGMRLRIYESPEDFVANNIGAASYLLAQQVKDQSNDASVLCRQAKKYEELAKTLRVRATALRRK